VVAADDRDLRLVVRVAVSGARRRGRLLASALLATVALVTAAHAHADEDGGADAGAGDAAAPAASDAGPAPHALAPPAPVEMPVITYPADAPPLAEPVEVEVILTIDATGAVTNAEVARSGGAVADAAVVAGVKRFRFHPATQDGVPIPVRIPFTQTFEPPPPPPPPTAPVLDAVLEGVVVERGTRASVASASIVARDEQTGETAVAATDAGGVFVLPLRGGRDYEIRIAAIDHERFVQREHLDLRQKLKVKYLIDRKSYGQYESFVRAETERNEVSRTTLSGPEITRVPGTFGDPFRVINVLPGVTSVSGLLPLPIVRGSSPGATGLLLDQIRLPLLFHLLAGPSVVHPEMIDHVDFYPGGFPVTYGGYTGGIVDGFTRAARPDERRIDIDLNLTQTGVLVREPLPYGMTATVAGRVGYPGIILSLLSPNVNLSYWDYQARLDGGTPRNHWTLFFFGAQDDLERRPAANQPFQTLALFTFHRQDFRYQHGTTESNELYRVTFGYDNSLVGQGTGGNSQLTGDTGLGNGTWSVSPQIRVHRTPRPWLQLNFGIGSYAHSVSTPPPATNTPNNPNATNLSMVFNQSGFYSESGAFAEAAWVPVPELRVIPGVRADVYDERLDAGGGVTKASVDPRLLARYHLTDVGNGSLWVKGVIGRYHQPPRLFVPVPGLDTSALNLGLLASTQYSVGVEGKIGKTNEFDVNTYYNDMDPVLFDLTVPTTQVQPPQPTYPPWQVPTMPTHDTNQTLANLFTPRRGRSYGLEVLLRRRVSDGLFGWISYTLSRSERLGTQGWQLFDFDRLHVFNAVAGIRLPRNWEFGTRVLYQTGTPLTDPFGAVVARADSQFRVDLRIDKRAVWNRWLLDFYVDIINTTVAAESGGLVGADSIRYIIPTIGVRGVL
jgi:TonB family protein